MDDQVTLFATTNFRNRKVKFGIKQDDRRRHMYLIGKTGMGKSTVLENMIISDIRAGNGLCVVDPHGDLVEKILDFIPSNRINDVVYFNPADINYPIAFNVLEHVDKSHQHLVASGLIGVFKKIWADSWGPRLEYVLNNAILALLEYPGSTLLGIMRMLTDKSFRKKVVANLTDPVVKAFWVDEYSKYPDRFQQEAIAPIQNKVGRFLSSALMRNVVGQVKSSIDIREIMDNRKILLLNLAKGRIGEDNSALIGAMMITKIQLAAMERIDIVEKERKDFYLYVDEFQNFATESFASILSEARKYRLNLIIAHQYVEQLDERVQAAVFGNVGSILMFRVGAMDAELLAKEFAPHFTEEDVVNLAKYDVYLKLMIDGVASQPFSATTLPPATGPEFHNETIIKVSRERYAHPRELVEEKIMRWSGMSEGGEGAGDDEGGGGGGKVEVYDEGELKGQPKRKFVVDCARCGVKVPTNFKPSPDRPIYCNNCLSIVKGEKKPTPIVARPVSSGVSSSAAVAPRPAPAPLETSRTTPTAPRLSSSAPKTSQKPTPWPSPKPAVPTKPAPVIKKEVVHRENPPIVKTEPVVNVDENAPGVSLSALASAPQKFKGKG